MRKLRKYPPIKAADERSVRSMAMVVRLTMFGEWEEIRKALHTVSGLSVAVISHSDIGDELACLAIVYAAHTVLARGAGGLERTIAERVPTVLGQGPGAAFDRLPRYWSAGEAAAADGTDLTAALVGSFMGWLEEFVAAQPGTATLDPFRAVLPGVVRLILENAVELWDLDTAARVHAMVTEAEGMLPEMRMH